MCGKQTGLWCGPLGFPSHREPSGSLFDQTVHALAKPIQTLIQTIPKKRTRLGDTHFNVRHIHAIKSVESLWLSGLTLECLMLNTRSFIQRLRHAKGPKPLKWHVVPTSMTLAAGGHPDQRSFAGGALDTAITQHTYTHGAITGLRDAAWNEALPEIAAMIASQTKASGRNESTNAPASARQKKQSQSTDPAPPALPPRKRAPERRTRVKSWSPGDDAEEVYRPKPVSPWPPRSASTSGHQ